MLLRQALEQTRARMPAPIRFNSLVAGLEPIDKPRTMKEVFDVPFHTAHNGSGGRSLHRGSAGFGIFSSKPNREASTGMGAHAS